MIPFGSTHRKLQTIKAHLHVVPFATGPRQPEMWYLNLFLEENCFVDTASPYEQADKLMAATCVVSCRSGGFDKLLTSSLGLLLHQSHVTGRALAFEPQTHSWNSPSPLNALSATQHSHPHEPPYEGTRTTVILFTASSGEWTIIIVWHLPDLTSVTNLKHDATSLQ